MLYTISPQGMKIIHEMAFCCRSIYGYHALRLRIVSQLLTIWPMANPNLKRRGSLKGLNSHKIQLGPVPMPKIRTSSTKETRIRRSSVSYKISNSYVKITSLHVSLAVQPSCDPVELSNSKIEMNIFTGSKFTTFINIEFFTVTNISQQPQKVIYMMSLCCLIIYRKIINEKVSD